MIPETAAGNDDAERRSVAGGAEAEGRFPQRARDRMHRILGHRRDQGDREQTRPPIPAAMHREGNSSLPKRPCTISG